MKTISDFPSTIWNQTSVKQNSDSEITTPRCLPMFYKFGLFSRNYFWWTGRPCILLGRLAYPCRFSDLLQRFGRPVPELSLISNTVMNYIYENHQQRLTNWNQTFLNPAKLEEYAQAISDRGTALKNCFGFIDGTVRPICRPDQNQRVVYNGPKIVHGLKFQSVSLPNGMLTNPYGPLGEVVLSAYRKNMKFVCFRF